MTRLLFPPSLIPTFFAESNPSVSTANKYRFKECMHAEIVTEHVVNEMAKKDPTISKKDRNKSA